MTLTRAQAEDFPAFCTAFRIGLFDWQREAFGAVVRREDGRFVHPLAGVSAPRGDGKSYAAAAVGVWRLIAGPPPQHSESADRRPDAVEAAHGAAGGGRARLPLGDPLSAGDPVLRRH